LDEDYLVLSTIHSAKGLEWDCVYVIHASDGNIPSDMATGSPEGIEEERRLFYVALTRSKRWLYVCYPLRYYYSGGFGQSYGYAQLSRFLPDRVVSCFRRVTALAAAECSNEEPHGPGKADITSAAVRKRTKRHWE
jgi:DNA helicase-2/ATP-dependent DNA helicase PcrA